MFDRAWLLTWTCYGNWLPGDPRGFVGFHPTEQGERKINNQPGTTYDHGIGWLEKYAESLLKEPPRLLTSEHAEQLIEQFRETARYRGWFLPAVAVLSNHIHLVVLVAGDAKPETLLHSFKSYASRRLNALFGKHEWWTSSGSTRKLPDEYAIRSAVRYVRDQLGALHVEVDQNWLADREGEPRQGEPRQS